MYPTPSEFKDLLRTQPLESVVQNYLFEGIPYVFRRLPERQTKLAQHLGNELQTKPENVRIIGSAKIGFSLSPDSFTREFNERSDIDVLIVDAGLFDRFWHTILQWHYPRRGRRLAEIDFRWCSARKDDLYWGWFCPDEIRFEGLSFPQSLAPVRDFSTKWFAAFKSLSLYPEFAARDVSGRLYRSWEHALLYHTAGLSVLRAIVSI